MHPLTSYKNNIKGNIFGGVSAAIVALPLALAFGISSGAGPIAGLYGAIIVGFFAAVFGGTASQISGPTGPMTVVMAAVVASTTARYPESGMAIAFTTVFLAGVLQVVFGLLKLGKYIVMVPYPVISGFMSGIGVIIIILQLAPLAGLDAAGGVLSTLALLSSNLGQANISALVIGLIALSITFAWSGRLNRIVPAPLVAIVVASLCALFFAPGQLKILGEIPSALPQFVMPTLHSDMLFDVLVNAFMLATLGAIDSLLTSIVADNVSGQRHHSDQELIGQGIGNAVAGLFGGLPSAGATMRTLVNIRAGGDGPLSGVSHSLLLLLAVLGAGFVFEQIPLAALAGILIKVGLDIIDWPFIKRVNRLPLFSVLLMATVFVLTVAVDLITAVFVGVFIKNIVTLSQLADLEVGSIIHTDGHDDSEGISDTERQLLQQQKEVLLVRIAGPINYVAGRGLQLLLESHKNKQTIVLDISQGKLVGVSAALALESFVKVALGRGTQVKLIAGRRSRHKELDRLGLFDMIGPISCVASLSAALN